MRSAAPETLPPPPEGVYGWPWMGASPRFPDTMPDGSPWPKISIVTPNYNYARFLEATIRSVLLQGYPNLEYLVIDGASTDGSVDCIKRYEPRLAYWHSRQDRGHADAINSGMRRATGEIMAWINSDDMYMPWTLRTVAEIFTALPEVTWLVGHNSWWDGEGRHIAVKRVHKNIYNFLLGDYGWIQQESVFWRRSLWEKAGGALNEEYRFQIDCELWCRFFLHADLWHADPVLGGYRSHPLVRTSRNMGKVRDEIRAAIGTLRGALPPGVSRNARTLRILERCRRVAPWLRVEAIGRAVFPGLYRDADYRRVSFIDGKWAANRAPFRAWVLAEGLSNWHSRIG